MTLNLDLTQLLKEIKKRDIKLYPTMIYLFSMIVNRHEEFRMTIDKDAGIGVFDFLHPSYTIFQNSAETFTNIMIKPGYQSQSKYITLFAMGFISQDS